MSVRGLQIRLLSVLILLSIGTIAYANEPTQELDAINLSNEFLESELIPNFKRSNPIKLNAYKVQTKKVKQKNLSKKFGPLLIGCKVRSLNRTAISFNIDVLEAIDILAQKDPALFLKTDDEHFILSPQTKEDVLKTINMFKAKFKGTDSIQQETVSAQLI
jgi:hypothetical protein